MWYFDNISLCSFQHKNPEDPSEVPGGFVSDCNKVSIRCPKLASTFKGQEVALPSFWWCHWCGALGNWVLIRNC